MMMICSGEPCVCDLDGEVRPYCWPEREKATPRGGSPSSLDFPGGDPGVPVCD